MTSCTKPTFRLWYEIAPKPSGSGGGRGLLLHTCCNRLMGTCCWMGSHFHDLTDPNGIDFNGIDYNSVDCNGIDYGIDFNDFN